MARKPFRHKILTQEILERVCEGEKASPPELFDEFLAFTNGVIAGLLDRLERRDSREADAARAAYGFALDRFGKLVRDKRVQKLPRSKRLEVATLTTRYFMAGVSPRASDRSKKLDPINLLMAYGPLVEEVSKCRGYEKRKNWLRKQGMNENDAGKLAARHDAEIVERTLAKRKGISHSELRKALAGAPKELKALLGQTPPRKVR